MNGDPSVTPTIVSIVDAYTLVGSVTLRPESLGFESLFEGMQKRGVGRSAVISLRALHADARKGNADCSGWRSRITGSSLSACWDLRRARSRPKLC